MTVSLEAEFRSYGEYHARRVLTQLDRDPDSPTYGCFDRNYWHYKIRDFPSTIVQQGVVVLEALHRGNLGLGSEPRLAREWALAAINALSRQVDRAGGVDEYYPYERSFPAAAFGLYAACLVLRDWQRDEPERLLRVEWSGLARLARQLAKRSELQASNQYGASVAGLALAARLPEFSLSPEVAHSHAQRLLSRQHDEGWFEEYGGPDFGYLTVTLDALVDYIDTTGDERATRAVDRAVEFIASMVGPDGELPWTLNSRNTDYVVPYGLVRTAAHNPTAAWLVSTLFAHLGDPQHAIWATDDRYHLHYIYASIVRSIPYLEDLGTESAPDPPDYQWLPGCGFWVKRDRSAGIAAYVAARKGGLVRIQRAAGGGTRVEHGWRVRRGKAIWASNWWGDHWRMHATADHIRVEGRLQACRYQTATPPKHLVLRALSWLMRERLVAWLKRMLIFRPGNARGPEFRREVRVTSDALEIDDRLGPLAGGVARPAPRQNLRHVASADSFHAEEWSEPLVDEKPLPLDDGVKKQSRWPWPTL